ncbi:putative ferric-chelate reductase 1 isoform X1 [Pomacea canaliculata]|uniref:putative ferric-chelate reductase 1 isoform X1 n=1 Tax=Pomacea canaliculata TaxID=400727 RepID=UPI000D7263E0|nr:putative ferric-chelate reductase 1 isoform X1 [Pomacea canaliculata]
MGYLPQTMVVVVALLVSTVSGYPSGAPENSCGNLTPSHGGSSSMNVANSPFTVTASKGTYSPGETITVTLKSASSQTFSGFLVQARSSGSTNPLGTFGTASGTRQLTCGSANSASTHSSGASKSSIQLTWTAPQTNAGTVTFWATFVQSYSTFYVGVQSSTLTYMSTQTSTTSSSTKTTKTSASTSSTTMSTRTSTTTSSSTKSTKGSATVNNPTTAATVKTSGTSSINDTNRNVFTLLTVSSIYVLSVLVL